MGVTLLGFFIVCLCSNFVLSEFCEMVLSVLSSLAISLLKKRELDALLYLCCDCLCSVSLPHNAMGWSAVCDCGFSWSYSLTF